MGRLRALAGVFGDWGRPPDLPARWALALAGVAVVVALAPPGVRQRWRSRLSTRSFVGLCAFAAAALSLGYVAFYLAGGPRIVDATSYFLQARALAEGHFAWHVPEPSASFRGRFESFADGRVAGIFPPGYPLLLSFGFAVGAPMVVGPALAAAIVVATFALAREVARQAGLDAARADSVARLAALLSVTCGALRYHTADTMAHGACALAFAIATLAALRAGRHGEERPAFFLVAGLALGYVASTRFASSFALGSFLAWRCVRLKQGRVGALAGMAFGALPGLALLAIAQSSVTGHALASTQAAYYRTSDGPPGCFRYGFGAGIGCLGEHGDFVRARLADGYGALAALGVTLRRLAHHSTDVANFEPLALVALVPAFAREPHAARARSVSRACLGLVALQVVAYAPFYFDGDYPGGGARFFADVLPVEHALVALGVSSLAERARAAFPRAAAIALALSLAGFACHAAFAHESLRARDGGAPMFDVDALAAAHLPQGALLFFDTDHGFALAHDPDAAERAARGDRSGHETAAPIVARLRNDDHDRLLFDDLAHPPAFVYRRRSAPPRTVGELANAQPLVASIDPWQPPATWTGGAETWRFEAENDWPPLAQVGGTWAEPVWATDTCASPSDARRALVVHADSPGQVRIDLPIPRAGSWLVTPRMLVREGDSAGVIVLGDPPQATWEVAASSGGAAQCVDLPPQVITASAGSLPLVLRIPTCAHPPCTLEFDRTVLAPDPAARGVRPR